jgi:uncharacterized protein YciI
VSETERSRSWFQELLGFEPIYNLVEWGWCELRTPIPGVNLGIGQEETVTPQGGATLTFGVTDIAAARATSNETACASTGTRVRSRAWSGLRPSTTSTATASCWPSDSTRTRPAAVPEPQMDARTLVLLMRPAAPRQLDEDTVDALQEQHLAFLRARRDEGVMAATGPFHDRPDERWRGMCIYLVDRGRALELASEDPMVQAGWLELLALTWLTRPGALSYGPEG